MRATETSIETATRNGARVVSVVGEIDMGNAAELQGILGFDGSMPLVVDLTRCTFLDSHGLRALLIGARKQHASMALVCPPQNPVGRLLEIAAANRLYRFVSKLDEALPASR